MEIAISYICVSIEEIVYCSNDSQDMIIKDKRKR